MDKKEEKTPEEKEKECIEFLKGEYEKAGLEWCDHTPPREYSLRGGEGKPVGEEYHSRNFRGEVIRCTKCGEIMSMSGVWLG